MRAGQLSERERRSIPIIDTDSHVTEPPDLWTSRLSSPAWANQIPHLETDPSGLDRWVVGGKWLSAVAAWAYAGWREYPPSAPPRLEDADPGAWDPTARAARLDEYGLSAQVLYPNLLAFFPYAFLAIEDEKLRLECVEAYNDFLTEFCAAAPGRFIPLTVLPFWDVDAAVAEIERCRAAGHQGIVFGGRPHKIGLPPIHDDHWAPLFETAQQLDLSINFHTGFQEMTEADLVSVVGTSTRREYARNTSVIMLGNAEVVADVIMNGLCHRFPKLKFVSIESGFGWLPYLAEVMDWQWLNSGAAQENPAWALPSEYFRRNFLGTFWFERDAIGRLVDLYADNLMFETDFPHPTSLSPGPASSATNPADMVWEALTDVPTPICRKVLYENAARLYHVDADSWPPSP